MRARRFTTWLVLCAAVALAYATRRRRRGAPARRAVPAGAGPGATPAEIDPTALGRGDQDGELFIEALAAWDREPGSDREVSVADPAITLGGGPPAQLGRGLDALVAEGAALAQEDAALDDAIAQAEGESWFEHLEARSAELGPAPEHAIPADPERPARRHRTATGDTPAADRGSSGARRR